MDGKSDKQGHSRTDRATIHGRSSGQNESPVDWTPHEDVTRQATKADSLLSTVFWSHKEPSSPVQGYHQEKPDAERHFCSAYIYENSSSDAQQTQSFDVNINWNMHESSLGHGNAERFWLKSNFKQICFEFWFYERWL